MTEKRKTRTVPARFDQPGLTWDMPGLRWDAETVEIPITPMVQIALGLQALTDDELVAKAQTIHKSLTDNAAAFTGIDPDAAALLAAITAFTTKRTLQEAARQAAQNATDEKEDARAFLQSVLTEGAGWSETNIKDPLVLTKVYDLQADRTPTTSIDMVEGLKITFSDFPGRLDLIWNPVDRALNYEVQVRLASDPAAPWVHARGTSRSKTSVKDLTSGQRYEVRVRALGPNELEGPWSPVVEHLVP